MLRERMLEKSRAQFEILFADAGLCTGDPARALDHLLAMIAKELPVVAEAEFAPVELVNYRHAIEAGRKLSPQLEQPPHDLRYAVGHHTTSNSMKPFNARPLSGTWHRMRSPLLSKPEPYSSSSRMKIDAAPVFPRV